MRLPPTTLLIPLLACGAADLGGPEEPLLAAFRLDTLVTGLERPLYVTAAPGDTTRLFIIEQEGRIRIMKGGALLPTPFLAIEDSVAGGNEQGLLGLAFAPDYATSGAFYIHTTDPRGDIRVMRYKVSGNADLADPGSRTVILEFEHPFSNHNSGMLAFGADGHLYIGSGDGGSGGDPNETGQDPSDLLGGILRIDVLGDSAGYAIPAGNPFVGQAGHAPELWAYGLRNPWRFSFDRSTHELWIGDVGQGEWEEIDRLPAGVGGQNLGWDVLEGTHCFEPSTGCSTAGMTMPVFDYPSRNGRCSVTGGYVYRGTRISGLAGTYVYGDFCDGVIRMYGPAAGQYVLPTGSGILTFGEDNMGELYVGLANGIVARLRPLL